MRKNETIKKRTKDTLTQKDKKTEENKAERE